MLDSLDGEAAAYRDHVLDLAGLHGVTITWIEADDHLAGFADRKRRRVGIRPVTDPQSHAEPSTS